MRTRPSREWTFEEVVPSAVAGNLLGGFLMLALCVRLAVPERATVAETLGALDHWQQVLEQIEFLDPASPKRLMPRLQQLVNRAQLTQQELHILRGIARAVQKRVTLDPG